MNSWLARRFGGGTAAPRFLPIPAKAVANEIPRRAQPAGRLRDVGPGLFECQLHQPIDGVFENKALLWKHKARGEPITGHHRRCDSPLAGQVRKIQRRFLLKHQPSFQFMRQLAHVPRPAVGQQPLPALLRDLAPRQAVLPAKLAHQVLCQPENVLTPLPQGRQVHPIQVQPVQQVLAEFAGFDGGSKLTATFAESLQRPWLHMRPRVDPRHLARFLARIDVQTLNVAGKRESSTPGISAYVKETLDRCLRTS